MAPFTSTEISVLNITEADILVTAEITVDWRTVLTNQMNDSSNQNSSSNHQFQNLFELNGDGINL